MTSQRSPTDPGTHDHRQTHPAEDLADTLGSDARAQAQHYRDAAADKVDRLADGMDAAADELREDQQTAYLSGHVAELADGLGRISSGLREKSADEMLADVTRIARDNPGLFLAGSVALGFGIARFARASAVGIGRDAGDGRERAGRTPLAAARSDRDHDASSSVPGTVGHPARGNDTVDTTAPDGLRGTVSAIPGPSPGPGVAAGRRTEAGHATSVADTPTGTSDAGSGTGTPSGRSDATHTPPGRI